MPKNVLKSFEKLPYFTIESYRQLSGKKGINTTRVELYRLVKSGEIFRLKKGIYMPRDFYLRHHDDPEFSPAVSGILEPQSYTSSIYELQINAVLTEVTYPITAITLKYPRNIINSLGVFSYQHIRSDLYMGFDQYEYFGVVYHRSTLAKALFDHLYLRPVPGSSVRDSQNLAEEMRLNLGVFDDAARNEFEGYVNQSNSKKMKKILKNIEGEVWRL